MEPGRPDESTNASNPLNDATTTRLGELDRQIAEVREDRERFDRIIAQQRMQIDQELAKSHEVILGHRGSIPDSLMTEVEDIYRRSYAKIGRHLPDDLERAFAIRRGEITDPAVYEDEYWSADRQPDARHNDGR